MNVIIIKPFIKYFIQPFDIGCYYGYKITYFIGHVPYVVITTIPFLFFFLTNVTYELDYLPVCNIMNKNTSENPEQNLHNLKEHLRSTKIVDGVHVG